MSKQTPEELAERLDELLTGLRVSVSAFLFYFKQGKDALQLAERIHFQTGALEMLGDVNDYLPAMADTEKLLRFAMLGIQERLTEMATKQDEKKEA